MAYIVYDPDATSFIEAPNEEQPTFINAVEHSPHFYAPNVFRSTAKDINARRNILTELEEKDSVILPQPSERETVLVYLRIKPKTSEESHISATSMGKRDNSDDEEDEEDEMVKIESDYQVALTAPKDSNTYKNCINGAGKLEHRYSFTKIFSPETDQAGLFHDMVMPRMQYFLEGQNQLIFTYGASSSGKTYTIQGTNSDPGVIPRALDVIFNTIGDNQMLGLDLKPNCFNRVVHMKDKDVKALEADKHQVFQLGIDLQSKTHNSHASMDSLELSDVTNLSRQSINALFPDISDRTRENSKVELKNSELNYAVWISFAEIYNENIHDLLEKMPNPVRKGEKSRRAPLKLSEDKNGSIFIKGLKEIKVNSADEAYKIMMIGRENLHFAATRLNHHSSRSHCIFTIKLIRVAKTDKPHLARVSMLSFCDLAGSERTKKTLNTGERQKEAGNINASLMVLGRCIKAIRQNQQIKDSKRHQIVPYRDSKLTRLFQSFLVGYGKASMIVNISQANYLFDESLQVLKFSAIASKILVVEQIKTPETVKPNKKKSRFSMIVDAANHNSLMGRGSIEWEVPVARSTICPKAPLTEESFQDESMEENSVLEETVIESGSYEKLMNLIYELKDQLDKERQEKNKIEKEVRAELCEEFNLIMIETEQRWEKRLKDEKERTEELTDWQIQTLNNELQKRKRRRQSPPNPNETALFCNEELVAESKEKDEEIQKLQSYVEELKNINKDALEDKKKLNEEIRKIKPEQIKLQDKLKKVEADLLKSQNDLKEANDVQKASIEANNVEPILEDVQRKYEKSLEEINSLKEEKSNLKELLDEASEEYSQNEKKIKLNTRKITDLEQEVKVKTFAMSELKGQLEELRLLLEDSNARLEEKEKMITELEETVESDQTEFRAKFKEIEDQLLEEKKTSVGFIEEKTSLLTEISKLKEESLTRILNDDLMKKEACEEVSDLKNELDAIKNENLEQQKLIDDLKKENEVLKSSVNEKESKLSSDFEDMEKIKSEQEKKIEQLEKENEDIKKSSDKYKTQLDERKKEAVNVDKEIVIMQNEIKSLIQAEKHQANATDEARAEAEMLRKQLKDINEKQCSKTDLEKYKKIIADKDDLIEKLNDRITSIEKDGSTFKDLKQQLGSLREEKTALMIKVEYLQGDVDSKKYDVSKLQEERDQLKKHYEDQIKKRSDELAVEKRESLKLREIVSRSTPNKNDREELRKLKEELRNLKDENRSLRLAEESKTEVIKNLEKLLPTNNSEETEEELQKKVIRLEKELTDMRCSFSQKEKATDKVLNLYREKNFQLQKKITNADKDEYSDTSLVDHDSSVEATPNPKKRKKVPARRGRKPKRTNTSTNSRIDSSCQVSFEDSNIETEHEISLASVDHEPAKKTKRITRSRPVNTRSTVKKNYSKKENIEDANSDNNGGDLKSISEQKLAAKFQTPSRKRKLYRESVAPELFTPPNNVEEKSITTPMTVVTRQLRSRNRK